MDHQEKVWITLPDGMHNNYGIEIWCENHETVEHFIALVCNSFTKAEYAPFFQGGSNGLNGKWAYFEFWKEIIGSKHDDLLMLASKIAEDVGLPFDI